MKRCDAVCPSLSCAHYGRKHCIHRIHPCHALAVKANIASIGSIQHRAFNTWDQKKIHSTQMQGLGFALE